METYFQSAIENLRMYLPEISLAVQLIVAVLIGFYALQVRNSVNEMKKHRMSLFKPIMGCEWVSPQKQIPRIYVGNIRNYGKGPAFNIRVRIKGTKYETEERGYSVFPEKGNERETVLRLEPKDHEQRSDFELAEGVKRGTLVFIYEDIAKNKFETRIEFWKENHKWLIEFVCAGKESKA